MLLVAGDRFAPITGYISDVQLEYLVGLWKTSPCLHFSGFRRDRAYLQPHDTLHARCTCC